jgi:hypothetical protein
MNSIDRFTVALGILRNEIRFVLAYWAAMKAPAPAGFRNRSMEVRLWR